MKINQKYIQGAVAEPPIWRAMAAARPSRRRIPLPLPVYPRQTGSPQSCVCAMAAGTRSPGDRRR
jgi:hypothetical protein